MKKPSIARSRLSSNPVPLLLSPSLSHAQVIRILRSFHIHNFEQADRNLQAMAGDPHSRQLLSEILEELLQGVSRTADPDQALNEWDRYVQLGPNRSQLFGYLRQAPRILHLLCLIFGNSPAMTQTLIRDPLVAYWIGEEQILGRRPSRKILDQQLNETLIPFRTYDLKFEALRRFKRREMLRIGVRDLLGLATVQGTVAGLSDLADAVVQTAYELVSTQLEQEVGSPAHYNAKGQRVSTRFVVLGMGKLGGIELNYSSDIDLIFVYEASDGYTSSQKGQPSISNSDYFHRLARELTRVLSVATQEGALFRVDLRLRPDGAIGAMVQSVEDMVHYYRQRGRTWERLAYVKARPIAGSLELGNSFLRILRPFVLGKKGTSVSDIQDTIQTLKTQIHSKMVRRGETERNVKLGTGGIREIEFIVQSLQLRYGLTIKRVLERNTLRALTRLAETKLLSPSTSRMLTEAYIFLRNIEHKLQMVNELQTHQLPADVRELAKCAIRLGYPRQRTPAKTVAPFLRDYRKYSGAVHRTFKRIVDMKESLKTSESKSASHRMSRRARE